MSKYGGIKYATREEYLTAQGEIFDRDIAECTGLTTPPVRVATGFPVNTRVYTGKGSRSGAIGQAWHGAVAADGIGNIVISPVLIDPVRVGGVHIHERLHHAVGIEHGHRKPFADACRAVDLTMPATATGEGDDFADYMRWTVLPQVGDYPHAEVDFTRPMPRKPADPENPDAPEDPEIYPDGRKKQTTRLMKAMCPNRCTEMSVNITRRWATPETMPLCPCCSKSLEIVERDKK
jgi:hypothetical protein